MPLDWLPTDTSIVAVAAYNLHNLVLLSNGQVYGWGDNGYGQLGVNDKIPCDTPTRMVLPDGITATAIACGGTHSLIVTNTGAVLGCDYNYFGQLGTGDNTDLLAPEQNKPVVMPNGVSGIVAVAAGVYHSLALTTGGKAVAFGRNYYGELGDNYPGADRNTAVYVDMSKLDPSVSTIASIAAGTTHSLAVTNTGIILAWGNNWQGQLGNGGNTSQPTPVRVNQLIGITNTAVAGGQSHSIAR